MSVAQWFLALVAAEEAIAGVFYLFDGEWRKAVIWVAYALATLAIAF
jgi:hypothetical protein